MMSLNKITFLHDARDVAVITLNRPALHNAFDDELIAELIACLKHVAHNQQIKLLVLKATGKSFCAGADLNWMQRMIHYSYEENRQDALQLSEVMYQLAHLPQPTLAVVNGAAYGGGVGLVACCDLVIAQTAAQFCLSEVKLGLMPAVISPYVLAKVGLKAMQYYSLTANVFDAATAKQLGLIDEMVAADELDAATEKMLATLLSNGPQALQKVKQLLVKIREPKSFAEIRCDTVEAIAKQRISAEGQEGLKAFLEKRKPHF